MDDRLQVVLWRLARSINRLRMAWCTALIGAILLVCLFLLLLYDPSSRLRDTNFQIGMLLATIAGMMAAWIIVRNRTPSAEQLASKIEAKFPELKQTLSTAIDKRSSLLSNPLLTREVRRRTFQHESHHRWSEIIPFSHIFAAGALNVLVLCGFITLVLVSTIGNVVGRNNKPLQTDATEIPHGFRVEPGDVEVERGSSLTLSAFFNDVLPLEVDVLTFQAIQENQIAEPASQEAGTSEEVARKILSSAGDNPGSQRFRMRPSLKDPVFTYLLSNVQTDQDYLVEYDGNSSQKYQIKVFDYPELMRSDALLVYPEYTGLGESSIEDTRRARVIEGTKIRWKLFVNKPLVECVLTSDSGERIIADHSDDDPLTLIATMTPVETQTWTVTLRDDAGRQAKMQTTLRVTVMPNLPPQIKLTEGGDVSVSPLQEWFAAATINDDVALLKHGIAFNYNGEEQIFELDLLGDAEHKESVVRHLFNMEQLEAKPDDLVSYWFWAEDHDAKGGVRRTSSDLYFAEVRPFEEIFRQGQSPGGQQQQQQQQQQQGGAAQQAEELLELQKQILSATWNLRRNTAAGDTSTFELDIGVISQSQSDALTKLEEAAAQLNDTVSIEAAAKARSAMEATIATLGKDEEQTPDQILGEAISQEQVAYQALLQLRAREHEIVQSQNQQSQSSSASSSQRQQQINQLQLEQDQNRYETQSQASEQQSQSEGGETTEAMNRLKELAERQADLNEQIRQIESALQQAATPEQQRELEEQLKRLRESQQNLLQDTDELLDDMANKQSQAMQDAREQTQQARENIQQANESLQQGNTSEALNAGTRAEQSLKETEEELRQSSAGNLEDAVRNLRLQSQALSEQQEEIRDAMQQRNDPSDTPGLRSGASKEDLQEAIQQQRERLEQLQQQMQDTVLQAEQSEPLLADDLYRTYQDSVKQQLDEKLQAQSLLMERAMPDEAQQLADDTREQFEKLQRQIEDASQNILGSDAADLERAAAELQRLRDQIDEELRQNGVERESSSEQSTRDNESVNGRSADQSSPDSDTPGRSEEQADESGQDSDSDNAQQSGRNPRGARSDEQSSDSEGSQADSSESSEQEPSEANSNGGASNRGQSDQEQDGNQRAASDQQEEGNERSGGAQSRQNGNGGRQSTPEQSQNAVGGSGGLLEQLRQMTQEQDANQAAPLTGDAFGGWNDALRSVEQLLDNQQDRATAAEIRQRARQMRLDFKRYGKEPQWDLVEELIATPLDELLDTVALELQRKKGSNEAIVPLDRDPIPSGFESAVENYYRNLGAGK